MGRLVSGRFRIDFTLLEVDDDGEPMAEYPQHPITLQGMRQVRAFLDELPAKIAEMQGELSAVTNGNGQLGGE